MWHAYWALSAEVNTVCLRVDRWSRRNLYLYFTCERLNHAGAGSAVHFHYSVKLLQKLSLVFVCIVPAPWAELVVVGLGLCLAL